MNSRWLRASRRSSSREQSYHGVGRPEGPQATCLNGTRACRLAAYPPWVSCRLVDHDWPCSAKRAGKRSGAGTLANAVRRRAEQLFNEGAPVLAAWKGALECHHPGDTITPYSHTGPPRSRLPFFWLSLACS